MEALEAVLVRGGVTDSGKAEAGLGKAVAAADAGAEAAVAGKAVPAAAGTWTRKSVEGR